LEPYWNQANPVADATILTMDTSQNVSVTKMKKNKLTKNLLQKSEREGILALSLAFEDSFPISTVAAHFP
jgi:hypothetical protein